LASEPISLTKLAIEVLCLVILRLFWIILLAAAVAYNPFWVSWELIAMILVFAAVMAGAEYGTAALAAAN
jgi:hypothetical protein